MTEPEVRLFHSLISQSGVAFPECLGEETGGALALSAVLEVSEGLGQKRWQDVTPKLMDLQMFTFSLVTQALLLPQLGLSSSVNASQTIEKYLQIWKE